MEKLFVSLILYSCSRQFVTGGLACYAVKTLMGPHWDLV